MAETLSNFSFVCYILAILFFVAGIVLFILFRIPKTFNDYTGRSARKRIMNIRANNERTGNKSYRPSEVNKERGKITENIPEKVKKKKDHLPETGIISDNKARKYDAEATGLLEETKAESSNLELFQPTRESTIKLKILNEVMFVHTDEVIE